jgi:hypothetical protein
MTQTTYERRWQPEKVAPKVCGATKVVHSIHEYIKIGKCFTLKCLKLLCICVIFHVLARSIVIVPLLAISYDY